MWNLEVGNSIYSGSKDEVALSNRTWRFSWGWGSLVESLCLPCFKVLKPEYCIFCVSHDPAVKDWMGFPLYFFSTYHRLFLTFYWTSTRHSIATCQTALIIWRKGEDVLLSYWLLTWRKMMMSSQEIWLDESGLPSYSPLYPWPRIAILLGVRIGDWQPEWQSREMERTWVLGTFHPVLSPSALWIF